MKRRWLSSSARMCDRSCAGWGLTITSVFVARAASFTAAAAAGSWMTGTEMSVVATRLFLCCRYVGYQTTKRSNSAPKMSFRSHLCVNRSSLRGKPSVTSFSGGM